MSNDVEKMFKLASTIALPNDREQIYRNYWLGAVGIRKDGVMVLAKNQGSTFSKMYEDKLAVKLFSAHAEGRVIKKMDNKGIIFVVRVSKEHYVEQGIIVYKNARPCEMCQQFIKSKRIKKVFYTAGNDIDGRSMYGVWYPDTDKDVLFYL
jgi:tRNA(Arg) A34 adenosine deaminase TadA